MKTSRIHFIQPRAACVTSEVSNDWKNRSRKFPIIGNLATILVSLSLIARVHAADATHPLTLKDARELALKNHPRISQAELEALASKESSKQVRAGFFPTLTFNATGVEVGDENNTRVAAGQLSNGAIYDRAAGGVNGSIMLTDFGRTSHLLKSSRLSEKAADANAEATREDILLQVDIAYFSALKAQSVLAAARQTLATRKTILDQVEALAKNKLRSDLDVSFARVALEEGNLLVAKAAKDLAEAFTILATLMDDRVEPSYSLTEEMMPTPAVPDAAALIEIAMTNRPDLARLRYARDAALQYASAQRALSYPTLNAFGSGGIIPIRDTAHFQDNYIAGGVNLSWQFFDGGLDSAKRAEAAYRAQAADEKLRDAENNAIRDVRDAGLNMKYAREKLDLTGKLFANASRAYELAQARYKIGSSSIVELSQAQLNKTTAEFADIGAKYDAQIQRSLVSFHTGTLH